MKLNKNKQQLRNEKGLLFMSMKDKQTNKKVKHNPTISAFNFHHAE